jgi:hypothetical protein
MGSASEAGQRARSCFIWLGLAMIVALGVTACSAHIPPRPLPELHMSGVSKVQGFDRFYKTVGVYPNQTLGNLTAYQPGGSGQPGRVLLPLGGKLYDVGLDGKPPRSLPLKARFKRTSVSPDGRWLLCSTSAGIIVLDLQTPSTDNVQVALANENRPDWPAFGPDDQRFAVSLFADKDCELGMYAFEPPHSRSRLVTGLYFPDLVEIGQTWAGGYAHACEITDVTDLCMKG